MSKANVAIVMAIVLGLVVAVIGLSRPDDVEPQALVNVSRPNILLILADDLGTNDVGLLGDGSAQTPNIDELARTGARFRRHYANATCRPSRMALLTGMPSSAVGVPPHIRGLTPELVTLPEALGRAGYATQHIGKWHLGHHLASSHPDQQGFDDWFGFLTALQTRYGSLLRSGATYINPWLQEKGSAPSRREGHMTDLLTDMAVQKIGELSAAGRPWFINLWYFAPHQPVQPAPEFAGRYPATAEGAYLALVAQLDYSVGRVMAALHEAGAADNTLVVFLSDNGGTNRSRNSNKPFFGKKNTFLEGGLRTPFILNFPGHIEPVDITAPVFINEVMPTLLAYAGVPIPPNVSGRNVLPLLAGADAAGDSQYFWDFKVYGYAKYGVMDLARGTLVYGWDRQLWEPARDQFAAPAPSDPALLVEASGRYRQWAASTRLVQLQRQGLANGNTRYTGDSYRRTPGFGGWTLQLPDKFAVDAGTTVAQEGQFQLAIAGGKIEVTLPGHHFSVPAPPPGCQLLSLASYYMWVDRNTDTSRGHVSLYLGEDLLYQQEFPIELGLLEDIYEPLVLSPDAGLPVISNDYLQADLLQHYERASGETPACPAVISPGSVL